MNKTIRWLGIGAVAAYLASCTFVETERASLKAEKDRKPAPEFALKDSSGAMVKLSDFRGKVVLLNFWATWCAPCKVEIPWFIGFEREYKDRNFEVLGISMDDDGWKAVGPYITRSKINYRVLIGGEDLGTLYGGVRALPTTFMIDREGRIARTHVGLAARSTYQHEILGLLGSSQNDSIRSSSGPASGGLLAFVRAE